MGSDEDKERHKRAIEAMEQFQARITLPILFEADNKANPFGSGVLFAHGDRHFILSAAHIFEPPFNETHLLQLASPDVRALAKPTTLGKFTITILDRKPYDFDAAVIELFDSDKIARLKQEWQFLTVEQVALPTADPLFCLGGFSVALARESKGALHGPMFVVRVIRLNGVPEGAENVDTNVDIFCEYATEGEVRQLEKMMPTPKLQGTSGGSLLQYVPNDSAIWSAATTMKLVGIQSSGADTRAWFRVKNWHAILNAFRKHDADLAKFISERLEMDIAHGQGGR